MKKIILLILILDFSVFNSAYAGESPNRIISLAPNITEMLFAMNLGDKVIGVTSFCDNLYRLGPRVVKGIEEMAGCLK